MILGKHNRTVKNRSTVFFPETEGILDYFSKSHLTGRIAAPVAKFTLSNQILLTSIIFNSRT